MQNFPALRLILKLGRWWALCCGLIAATAALLLYPLLGALTILPALFALGFGYYLGKSYVELVTIIVTTVN
ncbi:MAG TPA: hypothetical protein GXX24_13440 [Paracoccus solventivorans]|uniref:Uncharacterized protein n=2 Tax=Paracoccus solventivorans TaxID=53463 RepID=A0A832PNR5_9RHOB|nr:hypothetical protein [Paracoccus solventivorans]